MKKLNFLMSFAFVIAFFSCSSEDDNPRIKNLRVCSDLSNNTCPSHQSSLSPTTGTIYSSAELTGIENANINISLWAWDGQEWLVISETEVNNGDKNLIHVAFSNQNQWPQTDYEVEYFVDSDPQLTASIDFVVE